MTNKEIINIFNEEFNEDMYKDSSRLHSSEISISKFNTVNVKIFGGMNGWGNTEDYLADLLHLVINLERKGIYAYMINMQIDALDDVFYVVFELRDLKEHLKGKPE